MLSKVGQTLRALVVGEDHSTKERSRKRQRESYDEDIILTPPKRARREEAPIQNTGWDPRIPFCKVAEWIVKRKQTFADSYIFQTVVEHASPQRLVEKVSSFVKPVATTKDSTMNPNQANHLGGAQGGRNSLNFPDPDRGGQTHIPVQATAHSTPKRDHMVPGYGRPQSQPGFNVTNSFQDAYRFKVPPPRPAAGSINIDRQYQRPPQKQEPRYPGYVCNVRYNGAPSIQGNTSMTMYEKMFGLGGVRSHNRSRNNGKLAAKESIRLDEKSRYAQLLQQFTSTPLSASSYRGQSSSRPSTSSSVSSRSETLIGTSIPSVTKTVKTPTTTPSVHIQPTKAAVIKEADLTERSFVELQRTRKPQVELTNHKIAGDQARNKNLNNRNETPSVRSKKLTNDITPVNSNRVPGKIDRHQAMPQPKFDKDSPEIVKYERPRAGARSPTSEQFEKALKDSKYLTEDWIFDVTEKYSSDTRKRERLIKEEEVKVQYFKEKRDEWDDYLEKRIRQKLSLAEKEPPVLEEDFEEEEAIDEFPELTDEMEAMVDDALRPYPPSEVLCEGFKLQISRKDMETLAGLNWLNDEVINFYMELLKDRGDKDEDLPKLHVFNTFFYPRLMSSGHAGVKRWTRRTDVLAVDYIMVPVHLGMHWCLAVVDFRKRQVRYYDSMGSNNQGCLRALRDYLEAESLDKKKQRFDTSDWELITVKDIPHQLNGSDCGMFACKFAEYISRDAEITFSQEHMPYFRRRMVYEIITKQLL